MILILVGIIDKINIKLGTKFIRTTHFRWSIGIDVDQTGPLWDAVAECGAISESVASGATRDGARKTRRDVRVAYGQG